VVRRNGKPRRRKDMTSFKPLRDGTWDGRHDNTFVPSRKRVTFQLMKAKEKDLSISDRLSIG
jgi:hypothetical protein